MIEETFDVSKYLSGGFNPADLLGKAQIVGMDLMAQFEACKYNTFLVQLDMFMSNIPQFAGSMSNLATQVGTGFSDSNTPVFISYKSLTEAFAANDY